MIVNIIELKKIRNKLGLSRVELAHKLGISKETLDNWEYRTKIIPEDKQEYVKNMLFKQENIVNESQIGSRLESLIEKKGLTPYKTSLKTGISQSTLSRIINKNSTPNASNTQVLAEFFGVSENWLLTGKQENTANEPRKFNDIRVRWNKSSRAEKKAIKEVDEIEEILKEAGAPYICGFILENYDDYKNNNVFNALVSYHLSQKK